MSVIAVRPPFAYFTDTAGLALDAGYVYVGVENLDPIANPITCYWDESLTIPAPIPIRTTGGYLSRNGAAGVLYTSGLFSILVKDKNGRLVYSASTIDQDASLRSDLASTASTALGDALVGVKSTLTGAIATTQHQINENTRCIFDWFTPAQIAKVKANDATEDVTSAIQTAFNSMQAYTARSIYFPAGTYNVSSTVYTSGILSARIFGGAGFDGASSLINSGSRTLIKWIGASSIDSPVVKHTRANGLVWDSISIDCAKLAGYGIQFDSDLQFSGAVRNSVERCSMNYAQRDGIIVGGEGTPTATPGQRQFYNYTFRLVGTVGCQRSGIHINEYNADQPVFDQCWFFQDDSVSTPWLCDNGIWFEIGGNTGELRSCESSCSAYTAGHEGSGYMIKNGATGAGMGARGLTLINCWSEENGGIYWQNATTEIKNPFVFLNCKSYGLGTGTSGRAVYIEIAGGSPAHYSFVGNHFNADVVINSTLVNRGHVFEAGNYWGSATVNATAMVAGRMYKVMVPGTTTFTSFGAALGTAGDIFVATGAGTGTGTVTETAGIIDVEGKKSVDGFSGLGKLDPASAAWLAPRFAKTVKFTLAGAMGAIYWNSLDDLADQSTLIITQDGTGSRIIPWASDQWANYTRIPQLTPGIGTTTTYAFQSDGNYWELVNCQTSGPTYPIALTTTQRDALTPVMNGGIIYNTTTGKLQGMEAGTWTNLI